MSPTEKIRTARAMLEEALAELEHGAEKSRIVPPGTTVNDILGPAPGTVVPYEGKYPPAWPYSLNPLTIGPGHVEPPWEPVPVGGIEVGEIKGTDEDWAKLGVSPHTRVQSVYKREAWEAQRKADEHLSETFHQLHDGD